MKTREVTLAIYSLLFGFAFALKLPSTFQRCKVGSELDNKPNECLRLALEDAISQLSSNGSKDLGIQSLDPLMIDEVFIEQGGNSSLAIKIKYTDNKLIGLRSVKVNSVNGITSSPSGFNMVVDCLVPRMELTGNYLINGKIIVLSIQGEGRSNITLVNVKSKVTIIGESEIRNHKEYLKITDFKIEMKPSRVYSELENLFNGDRLLGNSMNKFLNENWEEIYDEVRPSIEEAFGAISGVYAKRILERVQFKNIFITEEV